MLRITDYAPPGTERIDMGGDAWAVVRGLTEGEQLAILGVDDELTQTKILLGGIVAIENVANADGNAMSADDFRAYLLNSRTAAMESLAKVIAGRIRARSRLGPGQGG